MLKALDLTPCLVCKSCLSIYDLDCACRDNFQGYPPDSSEVSKDISEESKTPIIPFSSYNASLKPLQSRRLLEAMKDTKLLGEALWEQCQRARQYVATHLKDFSPELLEVLQVRHQWAWGYHSRKGQPSPPISCYHD